MNSRRSPIDVEYINNLYLNQEKLNCWLDDAQHCTSDTACYYIVIMVIIDTF